MKKAVVLIGGKQYIAAEGETLRVDLLPEGTKELETSALLVIDGDSSWRQNSRNSLPLKEACPQGNWSPPKIQCD